MPPSARLLPALLMLGWQASTALAQDSATRVRLDAERHLRGCAADADAGGRAECQRVRLLFLDAYGRARGGDPVGQRVTAELLQGRHPGMRRNLVEACAWRTVVILQGHAELRPQDPERWGEDCSRLGQQDHLAAHARAQELLQEIAGQQRQPVPARAAAPLPNLLMPGLVPQPAPPVAQPAVAQPMQPVAQPLPQPAAPAPAPARASVRRAVSIEPSPPTPPAATTPAPSSLLAPPPAGASAAAAPGTGLATPAAAVTAPAVPVLAPEREREPSGFTSPDTGKSGRKHAALRVE